VPEAAEDVAGAGAVDPTEDHPIMAVNPFPEGYRAVTPYLIVRGADRLLEFLRDAFDAEVLLRVPAPGGGVMHASARIADSIVELADPPPDGGPMPSAIHLYVPDVDATYARALRAGGTSRQVPTDHDYGERGATVEDPTGNLWFIATRTE
jgi:PhnB protein